MDLFLIFLNIHKIKLKFASFPTILVAIIIISVMYVIDNFVFTPIMFDISDLYLNIQIYNNLQLVFLTQYQQPTKL